MDLEIENKIGEEILRRALKSSYAHQHEKEKLRYAQDMLEALQEITDLPREDLEKIANEVRSSYVDDVEGYLSIKYQIIFVGTFVLILLGMPILAVWLL